MDGSVGLDRLPGLGDEQDRKYCAITIKPQVFLNLVPDHVIVHRMYPLAPDRTVVTQPGMRSRVYDHGGVLVPSEHHIGLFHDWCRAQLV